MIPKPPPVEEEFELVMLIGLDSALIGVANVWDSTGMQLPRAVYSGRKIVEEFEKKGICRDAAIKYVEDVLEARYYGPATPMIMWEPEE